MRPRSPTWPGRPGSPNSSPACSGCGACATREHGAPLARPGHRSSPPARTAARLRAGRRAHPQGASRHASRCSIWGHDDLDGITATVILDRLLTDLRGDVRFHIPQKGKEKHGIDAEVALRHAREGVKLVITVDCGITNRRQVEDLRAGGVDVIVTDHHEVTEPMPEAVANVDPKRPDSQYPYRGLAGAGVALKLAMGLAKEAVGVGTRGVLLSPAAAGGDGGARHAGRPSAAGE